MTIQDIQKLFDSKTIKKGRYYLITYCKVEKGYTKTTTTKVRFVNYYNIKSVKESGKTPTPTSANTQVIIPHILTYNTNTQNYLVHCYKTPNSKAKVTYQDSNGKIITKEEYETVVPPKKKYGNDSPVFQVKVQDIISLG